jgi:TetR/AcrR family transcriptional regulator, tetracycline repressor protein
MALDRETVVRTALRVLDEVGLEGLTLRRIAAELDVQAPALYWHFKNKQELLDEMATTMLVDALVDFGLSGGDTDWRDFAATYGRGLRRLLLRYRDGAKVFSGTYLTDASIYALQDAALRVLTGAGFSLRDAASGLATIYSYTVGFAIEEQAVHPRPNERSAQYDLAARAARIDPGRYPLALAAGTEMFTRFDERFEHGLQLILGGLEGLVNPSPGAGPGEGGSYSGSVTTRPLRDDS